MKNHDAARPFVFMLAPTVRSGTNYVFQLLQKSGVCEIAKGTVLSSEDYLLASAEPLFQFVDMLRNRYSSKDTDKNPEIDLLQARLLHELGEGLKRTIDAEGRLPVLLKTPSVRNIDNFFTLFGNEKLLLIVRDGRDTCESMVRSGYAKNYKHAFKYWKRMARITMAFMDGIGPENNADNVLLLRYEDVLADPTKAVMKVASWLNVPVDPQDFPDFVQMPIIGSSELGREKDGSFTYKTVPAQTNFNPVGRWQSWSFLRRRQFKKIANEPLVYFGYERDDKW